MGPDPAYDVAVVGGGPAGATAARAAALAGARTVLLERADLPRYKTCGGGLVGHSVAALPVPLRPLARDVVERVTVTADGRWGLTRGRRAGVAVPMVDRGDLDAALVAAARTAGVTVRTGVTVTGIEEDCRAVRVRCRGGEPVAAAVLVGADGSGGRCAGHVGARFDQVDLGLEAEVPVDGVTAARWRGRLLLDWGPVPGSYGWVFPKGGVLTVGVIGDRADGPRLRGYYRAFLGRVGLAGLPALHDSGHLTRCREPGSPLGTRRVLLAGDAAGLLEPWTREGISYALRSGLLAGRAAAVAARSVDPAPEVAAYALRVSGALGAEMAAGRLLLAAFRRRPEAFHALLAAVPGGWPLFTRVVAGDVCLAGELRRPGIARAVRALAG